MKELYFCARKIAKQWSNSQLDNNCLTLKTKEFPLKELICFKAMLHLLNFVWAYQHDLNSVNASELFAQMAEKPVQNVF